MTVTTTEDTIHQTGNGVTNTVSYPYKFFAKTDLVVINTNLTTLDETTLTLGTDYTIPNTSDAEGYPSGTEITLSAIPDSNTRTTVYRNLPFTQGISYPEDDPFPAKTHEKGLDKLTLLAQQVLGYVNKALRFANTSTSTGVTVSQPIANRGLKYNADATSIIPTDADPDTILAQAQAAADIAQAAMGNVPTPIANGFLQRSADNLSWVMKTAAQVLAAIGGISSTDLANASGQVIHLGTAGVITSNPTFTVDRFHDGFIKANINPTLPTTSDGIPRNILFDFNIEPGRVFTPPTNAKWDYNVAPTFVAWPDILLGVGAISNMIVTLPGTTGQYCDLTNIPFNNLGTQTWEIILNITPTQVGIIQGLIANSLSANTYAPMFQITAANKLAVYLSSNNSSFDIANGTVGTFTVTNASNIFTKLEFTGTQYKVSTSTNYNIDTGTGTWTVDQTITSSATINASTLTGLLRLGVNTTNTVWLKGTIDLAKSSVKINGGRNLLTPEPGVYLNRIIYDTQDGGVHYKQHYSQVSV